MTAVETQENPLRAGLRLRRTADPCIIVIFGASGDLAKRKLLPAIFKLVQQRLLPAELAIVGFARTEMSDDDFRSAMREAVSEFSDVKPTDDEVWNSFASHMYYMAGDINNPDDYTRLGSRLEELDRKHNTHGNRLFYLSVAPNFYAQAIRQLGTHGMT